jgi:integrase
MPKDREDFWGPFRNGVTRTADRWFLGISVSLAVPAHSTTTSAAVILSVSAIAGLAEAIRPDRLKALVLLSAWCGVRWGEVSELRRKDIGDDCQLLYVFHAVTRRDGQYRVDTPKSEKGRAVVVPPHIRDDLRHHLETNVPIDPEALLFPPARGGCHLCDKVFRDSYLTPTLEAIDIEKHPTIHDLRHFAGTSTARVGNLVETMGRLGHRTVQASLIIRPSRRAGTPRSPRRCRGWPRHTRSDPAASCKLTATPGPRQR